ncbi:MAG: hypothetical protein CSB48_11440 [Proteobacteria bacterium]|nr:MAG: hypothetical protein CSB48_11440 [Pseudomonadota bacterium]PIE39887.1 MAG: hypothetical protein CSA51_03675 [Gammaproteobacteria bacterium]
MGKLKSFQEQIQETVARGINAVEEQHKMLAEKSFEYAEKMEAEAKAYSVTRVREMHNDAMANAYSFIRNLNDKLATATSDLLVKVEGQVEEAVEKVEEAAEKVEEAAEEVKAAARKAARSAAEKKEEVTGKKEEATA